MGDAASDTSNPVALQVIGVRGRTYFIWVTLETSHPPMSWSNDEAPWNMELYVAHPTATQTHTRDIQETYNIHVKASASESGESATPQSGSQRDVRRKSGGAGKGKEGQVRQ